MNDEMFSNIGFPADPHWPIKDFFNSVYAQDSFLWAVPLIAEKRGCSVNESYCLFPDPDDPDPECHFEGVLFEVPGGKVIVSEDVCWRYLKQACEKYRDLHPADRVVVEKLMESIGR